MNDYTPKLKPAKLDLDLSKCPEYFKPLTEEDLKVISSSGGIVQAVHIINLEEAKDLKDLNERMINYKIETLRIGKGVLVQRQIEIPDSTTPEISTKVPIYSFICYDPSEKDEVRYKRAISIEHILGADRQIDIEESRLAPAQMFQMLKREPLYLIKGGRRCFYTPQYPYYRDIAIAILNGTLKGRDEVLNKKGQTNTSS